MRLRFILVILIVLGPHQWCNAQDVALDATAVSQLPQAAGATLSPALSGVDEFWKGWKQLPVDLLRDQKDIWLFPVSVARGRHLQPTAAFVGVTAGLVAVDGFPARYFRRTTSFDGFNKVFSGPHTGNATFIVPLALYGLGLARRDTYAQKTFLLAGEAVLDAEVLTSVMKDIDRRLNPHGVPVNGNYSDTWFKKPFSQHLVAGNGSFPSGHTIAAFSVATVYAERYRKHRWVPFLAYGLASLDGFSRMSLQSHFGSDVFAGASLGYFIAHHVVRGAH